MSNIYDLANELNRSFRELPEYKAVLESKASIDTDGEAKALFSRENSANDANRPNAYTRITRRNEEF